ncbi:DNA polymerase III subunit delta' [Raoultella terrigena]|uniref:DNA polymerase III subunit delta n=1 Tax=Raoultella terrigena TaxID=577 RepID=A0A485BC33_RAOTE|nr:DNA polymerase III subunit delta' [Raoultella terrigena]
MKWYPWLRPPFEQLVTSYQAGRVTMRYCFRRCPEWAAMRCSTRCAAT